MEFLDKIYTINKPKTPIYCYSFISDTNKILYMCKMKHSTICPYLLYSTYIGEDSLKYLKSKFIIFIQLFNQSFIYLPEDFILPKHIVYLYTAFNVINCNKSNNLQYYTNYNNENILYNQYLVFIDTCNRSFNTNDITNYLKYIIINYFKGYMESIKKYKYIANIKYPYNKNIKHLYDKDGFSCKMEHVIDG